MVIERLCGDQLSPAHWAVFHELYVRTARDKWAQAHLKQPYFEELGSAMGPRLLVIFAREAAGGGGWMDGAAGSEEQGAESGGNGGSGGMASAGAEGVLARPARTAAVTATAATDTAAAAAEVAGGYVAAALFVIGTEGGAGGGSVGGNSQRADCLYGRHWGCLGRRDALYFELCYYQPIEFAIERGISRVEVGAQGGASQGELKLRRGYEPTLTFSAHYVRNAAFRAAVRRSLLQEREQAMRPPRPPSPTATNWPSSTGSRHPHLPQPHSCSIKPLLHWGNGPDDSPHSSAIHPSYRSARIHQNRSRLPRHQL